MTKKLHKKSGAKHPHNLRSSSKAQNAPQTHDQPEGRRGRNKRKGTNAPEWMRNSGMAK